ncbi:MAG: AMP-binding protein, partial [Candidatus Bipolaricaulia bacterium]
MGEGRPWLKHYDEGVPPSIDYPHIPLYRILDEAAAKHPDRPCTSFFGRRLSYQKIKELSDRFAAGVHRLGIGKGDRVALLLPNSPQFVIAYYGILKAGGVVVPLNPRYSERELIFHLNDSEAETAVTIPLFLEKAAALRGKTPLKRIVCARMADFLPFPLGLVQGLRERRPIREARGLIDFKELLREEPSGFSPVPAEPEELAVLLYSGGTTGVAKGIMLSHSNFVANAHQVAAWGQLDEEERILAVLPLFHGYGMSVCMNASILSGMEIILVPKFNAHDLAKVIHKYRPTLAAAVPTMLVALAGLPDVHRYDFSSLKGIWVGAAPLTRAVKEDFEARTGGRAIEGYGLTEAVTAIMANPYRGRHKVGSIGIPFPDVEAKIVDLEDGHDLPPGEQGEIVLR